MKQILLTITLAMLVACAEKEVVIPEGFERLGGQGASHFVYVHKQNYGDKVRQRRAGAAICKKFNTPDYCEVYMWKKRGDVAKSLPFKRDNKPLGLYTIKNGRVKLKALK